MMTHSEHRSNIFPFVHSTVYDPHPLGGHLSKLVVHELMIRLGWWEGELVKKAVRREAKRMWNIGMGEH